MNSASIVCKEGQNKWQWGGNTKMELDAVRNTMLTREKRWFQASGRRVGTAEETCSRGHLQRLEHRKWIKWGAEETSSNAGKVCAPISFSQLRPMLSEDFDFLTPGYLLKLAQVAMLWLALESSRFESCSVHWIIRYGFRGFIQRLLSHRILTSIKPRPLVYKPFEFRYHCYCMIHHSYFVIRHFNCKCSMRYWQRR